MQLAPRPQVPRFSTTGDRLPSAWQQVSTSSTSSSSMTDSLMAMANYLAGVAPLPPVHQLPCSQVPTIAGRHVDLCSLFRAVVARGGFQAVTACNRWGEVLHAIGVEGRHYSHEQLRGAMQDAYNIYSSTLLPFEEMQDPLALTTGRQVSLLG